MDAGKRITLFISNKLMQAKEVSRGEPVGGQEPEEARPERHRRQHARPGPFLMFIADLYASASHILILLVA